MQSDFKFKDKFIAYIDILGWKSFVEEAEVEANRMSLHVLIELLDKLGSQQRRNDLARYGPTICPNSKYLQRDLDFQLAQAYDCVVVSSEISPAGAINLITHCWSIAMALLGRGFMCRGYITRGTIFHTEKYCIGTGHQKAIDREKKVSAFKRKADEDGTPFVEVDKSVCDYIERCDDACVNKIFAGHVKSDGDLVALFPIQRLAHQFIIAGYGKTCDLGEEKRANNEMRLLLGTLRDRVMTYVDKSNARAVEKSEHYITALDEQLRVCDFIDETIAKLGSPFPRQPNQ
jgi:hypothetical protein